MVSEAFSGLAPLTEFLWRSRIAEPRATPSTSPDKSYEKLLTDSFLAMNGFLWRRPEMLKSPVSNLASPHLSIPPAAEYLRTSGSTFHPPAKISCTSLCAPLVNSSKNPSDPTLRLLFESDYLSVILIGPDLPYPVLPRDVDGLGNPPPEVATRAGKMEGQKMSRT